MKVVILPYKKASESAKLLAEHMNCIRIDPNPKTSKFKANENKVVINWGSSVLPEHVIGCKIINNPESVAISVDKIKTFCSFADQGDIPIPEFTTSFDEAVDLMEEGHDLVVRHVVNGHSGEGIEIISQDDYNENGPNAIPRAPLYTVYIKKRHEFRVHLTRKYGVFLIQKKLKKHDFPIEDVNWKIRNLNNGFIYSNIENQDIGNAMKIRLTELAYACIKNLNLDFCAVDIIYNEKHDSFYVLEVNCAPGLVENTSLRYSTILLFISERIIV